MENTEKSNFRPTVWWWLCIQSCWVNQVIIKLQRPGKYLCMRAEWGGETFLLRRSKGKYQFIIRHYHPSLTDREMESMEGLNIFIKSQCQSWGGQARNPNSQSPILATRVLLHTVWSNKREVPLPHSNTWDFLPEVHKACCEGVLI